MASQVAKSIVRDVLLAVGHRSNERDIEIAVHNVDSGLSELRDLLLDCDSNLSAYGHSRPLTKGAALELSARCRRLWNKLKS